MTKPSPVRGLALLALALVFTLTACESPTAVDTNALDAEATEATAATVDLLAAELAQDLSLSGTDANDLHDAVTQHRGRVHEPGFLWHIAADLQAVLTAEQKERLFAMAARAEASDQGFGGARGPGNPGFGDPHGDFRFLSDLLSEDQQAALTTIRETYRPQIEALFASRRQGDLTPEAFSEQMRALFVAMRAEIEALLTDEQKADIEARMAERQAALEAERAERRAAEMAAMAEALGLSEAQQAAVAALFASQMTQREALVGQAQEGALTPEQLREALDALRDAGATELQALLDDTQWEIVRIHEALSIRMLRFLGGPNGGPLGGRDGGPQRGGPNGGQRGGPSGG